MSTASADKRKLEQEIAAVEKQLYDLETKLLTEPFNVVTGLQGIHKQAVAAPKIAVSAVELKQRIFSLSSLTSPASKAAASSSSR